MGKSEIISHWLKMAERDWATVNLLHHGKQFIHALFFAHLVIEKILKAYWVRDNEESVPPFTHDLEHLYTQTELQLTNEQLDLIRVMNSWNLEARYQDYKDKFFKSLTADYTLMKLEEVEKLKVWLLSEWQNKK